MADTEQCSHKLASTPGGIQWEAAITWCSLGPVLSVILSSNVALIFTHLLSYICSKAALRMHGIFLPVFHCSHLSTFHLGSGFGHAVRDSTADIFKATWHASTFTRKPVVARFC